MRLWAKFIIFLFIIIVLDWTLKGPIARIALNHFAARGTKMIINSIDSFNSTILDSASVKLNKESWVYKIKVQLKGELNDTTIINNLKIFPGKVDTIVYNSVWYQPVYAYIFDPYKAKSGELEIHVTFYFSK